MPKGVKNTLNPPVCGAPAQTIQLSGGDCSRSITTMPASPTWQIHHMREGHAPGMVEPALR